VELRERIEDAHKRLDKKASLTQLSELKTELEESQKSEVSRINKELLQLDIMGLTLKEC